MKRTKIVCTIGPASEKIQILEKMVKAGMNVARLNFSHGTYKNHAQLIKNIRTVAKKLNQPIATLQDLQGPKIRVGGLPKKGVILRRGSKVVLTTNLNSANLKNKIPVDYKLLHRDVRPGTTLLLDDGLLELKVLKVSGQDIFCEVIVGGTLISHKGINLPNASLSIPAITKKDAADARFGVKTGVDFIALSFVKTAKDIFALRRLIEKYEKELKIKNQPPLKIVVKIEKHEAIRNINEIIAAADAVMIARGDLGIETPAEDVPLLQKMIIKKCLQAAKPVIVATQMLDSMMRNPRPTRAEVSDVANAVIDHTDAIMLSGESAMGKYPVEAVRMMSKIAGETEDSQYDDLLEYESKGKEDNTVSEALSNVAAILSHTLDIKLILAASLTGNTARLLARHRSELPIFVATNSERVMRQLNLSYSVIPFVLPKCRSLEEFTVKAIGYLKKNRQMKKGDKIMILSGEHMGISGNVNLIGIKTIQ
ncbi:MAG: pyruvate kinase [Patescibacteria group bacterium]|nr:pyruvate kinase [Patescibacteria group bacterium]MDD5490773.1 pyruvate kinase [Patescibacteria group bacterium]